MGITLVARGDDHMLNTPIQILLYEALGAPVPEFAHLPMILDERGKKMSKRDDAGSVEVYQQRGFVPSAVLNYLARLGWSHGDQEIFTVDELIEAFDWAHVGKEGARYDDKKFLHVQATHLRALPTEALIDGALPVRGGSRAEHRIGRRAPRPGGGDGAAASRDLRAGRGHDRLLLPRRDRRSTRRPPRSTSRRSRSSR